MKSKILLLLSAGLLLFATSAFATNFTFSDNSITWPGWGNGTTDDGQQNVGDPVTLSGGGTINSSGVLESVYFNYSTYNSELSSGDLFIDLGGDGYWDYVAHVAQPTGSFSPELYSFLPGTFSATKGVNDDAYYMSNDFFPSMDLWRYREDHPVAVNLNNITASDVHGINITDPADSTYFANFDSDTSTPVSFNGLDIDLGGQPFVIGWSPTCANNVIHTPEPGTAIFFGVLLFGFGIFGRRRFLKR